MRSFLDRIYRACGILAAIFLGLIGVWELAQIVSRWFDVLVPGADVIAKFCLAAASFFALAYTFKTGGHIRVTLLIRQLPATRRRAFELWCLAAGSIVAGYFTFYAAVLVWESYVFNNTAIGGLAVPLWIPQCSMALGLMVLTIALVDEFVQVLRNKTPSYGYEDEGVPESDG